MLHRSAAHDDPIVIDGHAIDDGLVAAETLRNLPSFSLETIGGSAQERIFVLTFGHGTN
jgi:hypothetical protein